MSSATSPGPNNMLLLAVLGIGAYWMMTRRAVATSVYAQPGQSTTAQRLNLLNSGINALGGLFSRVSGSGNTNLMGTYDGRAQTPWDVTPNGDSGQRANNPSAYVAPTTTDDGVVVNPPGNSDPWDWWN